MQANLDSLDEKAPKALLVLLESQAHLVWLD